MHLRTRQRVIGLLLLLLLAAILAPLVLRTPEQVRLALDMSIPEAPRISEPYLTRSAFMDASQPPRMYGGTVPPLEPASGTPGVPSEAPPVAPPPGLPPPGLRQ